MVLINFVVFKIPACIQTLWPILVKTIGLESQAALTEYFVVFKVHSVCYYSGSVTCMYVAEVGRRRSDYSADFEALEPFR